MAVDPQKNEERCCIFPAAAGGSDRCPIMCSICSYHRIIGFSWTVEGQRLPRRLKAWAANNMWWCSWSRSGASLFWGRWLHNVVELPLHAPQVFRELNLQLTVQRNFSGTAARGHSRGTT